MVCSGASGGGNGCIEVDSGGRSETSASYKQQILVREIHEEGSYRLATGGACEALRKLAVTRELGACEAGMVGDLTWVWLAQ